MQVSVENTGGLERRMHVRLDPEPFEEAFGRRLRETARTVRLNGFRPGKIPLKEVRRRFGTSIRAEVAVQLMQSSFQDALHQEDLSPAGTPTLDPGDLEATDGFQFTATFEILPEIELGDLSRVQVKRPEADVTDADVDAMIDRLRKGRTTWNAVERPARAGDRVTADLAQSGDGDFRHEGMSFLAGEEFFFPNVADAAVGMASGDTKRITSTFPEAMADEDLRGREAEFDLTVREIAEGRAPDLDEAFFASFGVAADSEGGEASEGKDGHGSEDAFRTAVRKDMEGRLTATIKGQLASQVMGQMVDLHAFEIPMCMVAERLEQIRAELPQLFGADGETPEPPEAALTIARREAEKSIREMLLTRAVIEREGLTVDAGRVRGRIEELASSYENPEQVVNWYYSQDNLLQRVESDVLREQVVDYVLSVADVAAVPSSHDDVMAGPAPDPTEDEDT
ncbi:MAG: trigger factor [Gammaproteobacteria bacterium]|nr:trigger factor [Gammaproteobacteria bacterium]